MQQTWCFEQVIQCIWTISILHISVNALERESLTSKLKLYGGNCKNMIQVCWLFYGIFKTASHLSYLRVSNDMKLHNKWNFWKGTSLHSTNIIWFIFPVHHLCKQILNGNITSKLKFHSGYYQNTIPRFLEFF